MKNVSLVIYTALITAVATFCFTLIFVDEKATVEHSVYPDIMTEVRAYIDRYAVKDFSEENAAHGAVRGYMSGLDDEHDLFWTEEEYAKYQSSTSGNYTGIGISLSSSNPIENGMFVSRVYGNSPAEEAGLKAGDLIVELNGRPISGRSYNEVYDEFAATPELGVTVMVQRGGEQLSFHLEFKQFVQRYVDSRMIGSIGYIRIHDFWIPAVAEFRTALNDILEQNPQGLIIDLRNNLGGSLDAVIDILDPLIPKGEECVVLKYKDIEEVIYSDEEQITDVPITVLINESSASASELMASCLRDVKGAKLVGERSLGKGVGQTLFNLSDGSVIKITTFYYMTKSRVNYDKVGLSPDKTVSLNEQQIKYFYTLDETNDPQLQAALTDVQSRLAS